MPASFTSPAPRGSAAILALYVKVGTCLLAIGADVRRIVIAGDLQEGRVLVDALLGADQLVAFGALLELIALVIAVSLFVRWRLVVRGNREVLGGGPPRTPLTVLWWVMLAVATLAVVLAWTVLGDAEDVADRQRIDALRAAATALSAVAAALTIAVVATVTRGQEERARENDAPRAQTGGMQSEHDVLESGLRVVSEEEARRG